MVASRYVGPSLQQSSEADLRPKQIWCAIAPKWVLFRIVCYYVIIWQFTLSSSIKHLLTSHLLPRVAIFATIILYILVGLEISKRQRALRLIARDIGPFDDTERSIPSSTGDHPNDAVAMTVEVHPDTRPTSTHSQPGSQAASTFTISSSRRLTRALRPSLSFRQYILMPLFFFLAMLSVWVAPSTNRVGSFVEGEFGSFPLLLTVGIMGSLRGFWNGLVFVTMGMKHRKRDKTAGEA